MVHAIAKITNTSGLRGEVKLRPLSRYSIDYIMTKDLHIGHIENNLSSLKLESKVGNIETKNISQVNYIHDLAMTRTENQKSKNTIVNINLDGITDIRGAMAAFTGTTDRNAFDFTTSKEHDSDDPGINYMSYTSEGNFGRGTHSSANQVHRIAVVLEKTGITSGTLTSSGEHNVL